MRWSAAAWPGGVRRAIDFHRGTWGGSWIEWDYPTVSNPGLPATVLTQEREQLATAVGVSRQGLAQAALATDMERGRVTGKVTLPAGADPTLLTIVRNNMLAPDVPNRMIFIKDTAERIAQMKKVVATLDVPTPRFS